MTNITNINPRQLGAILRKSFRSYEHKRNTPV